MICVGLNLEYWEAAKTFIQKAIELNQGELNVEDIYHAVLDKDMQLWGIHDGDLKAVMVTEIIIYPRKKHLRVVLIGGLEMDTWLSVAVEAMDIYKIAVGADGIEIFGRKGWVGALKQHGYKEYQTIVYKE